MKRTILILCTVLTAFAVQAQTVDEVLSKFEEANGGKAKLKAIKTLYIESVLKMGVMGQTFDVDVTTVKERNKLHRKEVGGIMGMGKSWTLVTDTAGYLYFPGMPSFGGGRGPGGGGPGGPGGGPSQGPTLTKMSEEERVKQKYEMDCAGLFASLVDYAAKGYKAELTGKGKVNKEECYKVKLTVGDGLSAVYYISTISHLVQQVEAQGEMAAALSGFSSLMRMMGGDRRNYKVTIRYTDYKEFVGIMFPQKEVISIGPVESTIDHMDIRLNEAIDEVWYKTKS